MSEAAELVKRLDHAIATASNDDYSTRDTRERERHVERILAMRAGRDLIEAQAREIERLTAALNEIDQMTSGRSPLEPRSDLSWLHTINSIALLALSQHRLRL